MAFCILQVPVKTTAMLEFNFSPFPVLHTQRLTLRRIGNADAEALFFLRSNDEVMRFLDKEKATGIEDVLLLIQRIDTDVVNNNSITWAMTLKEDPGHLVGHIGLWRITARRSAIRFIPDYGIKG